jgi:hypothetical protein
MLGAAAVSLVASHALAQFPPVTDPTKDEAKCQSSTGKALTGEVGGISKCTGKCFKTQRKVMGPYTECFTPYGGTTALCVNDTVKGPEAKAAAAIVKACMDAPPKDKCPECYAASNCNTGQPFAGNTEALAGATGQNVYCTEFGGNTPTKEEAKCEDSVSKNLVKFVGSINKCYDKCAKSELAGKIAPGSCDPPGTGDPTLDACLDKARQKTADGIDKSCFTAPAVAPACYDGTLTRPDSGAGWASLTETIVNGQIPLIACGSPSGAFL